MLSKICVCVATVLIICSPTSLIGGPTGSPVPETASARVALADLDLKTPAGLRDARRRLAAAAEHLCLGFMDSRAVSARETYHDCVLDALRDAERRLRAMVAESKRVQQLDQEHNLSIERTVSEHRSASAP